MSVPFRLAFIGGTIDFGSAPMHVVVTPTNGGGTNGEVSLKSPHPPLTPWSCSPPEPVVLAGLDAFVIRGTAATKFGPWNVEFAFPGPPGANQGTLTGAGLFWELTGKYVMMIRDTVTGDQCAQVVGASGEYHFEGQALSKWPHGCFLPKPVAKATDGAGQSPGLVGEIILRGHAPIFPIFGGPCNPTLASNANSLIGGKGFISALPIGYKLTY